jgi:thiol-disulfide isomerase/thioredoxin
MKEAIEAHVWLIENSAGPLDSVYAELNTSTDILVDKLKDNGELLNTVTRHLFKFLEQRSLFTASEYLALKMLNDDSCILETDLNNMMESYRTMKNGNSASDIVFTGDIYAPGYTNETGPQKLSEVKSNYKVVIFGSSWCPQCPKDLQEITNNFVGWKQHGVEIVFISLDEDKKTFESFVRPFPFISICDYQKWESKAVMDYYVFATPTIYLLNDKHEIILKPHSIKQLNAWIDWYLVKGNKLSP